MRKKRPLIFLCCCIYCLMLVQSGTAQVVQNLVKNPSFEQYRKVPADLGQVENASYWTSASKASPDYFHRRASGRNVDVPVNKMGLTKARTGYAYTGLYAYASRYSKRNFREYIQVQLKQPMREGEIYCIKAHFYLAHSSNRAVGALSVAGSRRPLSEEHETVLEEKYIYLVKEDRTALTDRAWTEINCKYKALGGEKYLIIGNFDGDRKTKVTGAIPVDSFKNPHVDFAYYYIDDVCVTSLKSNYTCDCGNFDYVSSIRQERIIVDMKITQKVYRLGQTVIMHGVEFEKNKAIFLDGSNEVLDDLLGTLRMHPTYKIEVSGHTDDRGNPQKNQELSKRRAKAVVDYLIAAGIDEGRLSYRGYGQSRPVALNDSPEGRAKNERIQFRVVKK